MVSTTRPMSCLTLRSRSGVPIWPRKYFDTTMLVACWDQNRGISTSRCSKTTWPFSFPITAERISHSISSNGSMPSRLKKRSNSSPGIDVGSEGWVVVEPKPGLTAAPLCIVPSEKHDRGPPQASGSEN